jgi:hypothetical protein
MAFLSILRIVVLCVSLLFALISLGLSAHLTFVIEGFFDETNTFTVLGLVTACLTVVTLPTMLIIDSIRKGAFTSTVLFELIWLGVLWVLWLATGAHAAAEASVAFPDGCVGYIFQELDTICHEATGITAFSFLNFILLFAYSVTLLIVALVSANRGHAVWTLSVKQTVSAGAKGDSNQSVPTNMSPYSNISVPANMPPYNNQSIPMQQPQLVPPAGYAENVYPSPIKQMGHSNYAEV